MLIQAKDIRQIFIFAIYYEDDQHHTVMNSVVVKLKPSNYVIKNLKTIFALFNFCSIICCVNHSCKAISNIIVSYYLHFLWNCYIPMLMIYYFAN